MAVPVLGPTALPRDPWARDGSINYPSVLLRPPPDSLLRPPASGGRGGGRDAADAADGLVAAVGVEVHQPPVGTTAPRPPAPPSSRGPGTTELSARFQTTFK